MTTPISTQYIEDVNQSLIDFFRTKSYIRSGAASYAINTMPNYFPTLTYQIGYVDNLDKLALPAITLTPPTISGGTSEAFGEKIQSENFHYTLHGFVGRQLSHQENMLYRDQLCQDLKAMLEDVEYITLKTFQSGSVVSTDGDIGVMNVVVSFIPPSEEPEAARYRFLIDFDVEYIKNLD